MSNVDVTVIPGFAGTVVVPGDADYEADRRVWNGMHDRRPAVIAHCSCTADVAAAVVYARSEGLEIAVRGGGHSMPGFSTVDDGIVISLRGMRSIATDPVQRTLVAQGGALLGDVDRAAQEHGMVVPAGVISHTGAAGLTLGGGVGRLMRHFGLTIDSLLSVEMVTVDGDVVTASEAENPELFWALRGGGGNFGIVTSFTYRMHVLDKPLLILFSFHRMADAQKVLGLGEKYMADPATPKELLWTSFLRKGMPLPWMPDELLGTPGVMSAIEWSGDLDEGRQILETILEQLDPAAYELEPIDYLAIQTAGDEIFRHGLITYVKAGFARSLTPDLVDALVARGELLGSEISQVEFLGQGGAIADVAVDATAYPHRTATWLINIPASWSDHAETDREREWVRGTYDAMRPYLDGTSYSNFMDTDEVADASTAYGQTLARLREVKAAWDPDNVLHLNQNIVPAGSA